MEIRKINDLSEIPEKFTGIVTYPSGSKRWFKDSKYHREDGPALEHWDGHGEWWLEDKEYCPKNLKDYVVLDHYKGKYGIMWYRLLDKDKLIEYPDIPGLVIKE